MKAVFSVGLLVVTVFATGCSKAPALVPVSGQVTFKGKPIVPGAVFIEPEGGPDGSVLRASGLLQLDGTFALRTYPQGDGAMPGAYRVYLQLGHGTKPDLAKFTDAARSPLTVVIPEDGLAGYRIELADYAKNVR